MPEAPPSPLPLSELDLAQLRLGESTQTIALKDRADNQTLATALVQQARRSLEIFSRDLEADIYDRPAFVDAVKTLALQGSQARIRILLQDADPVVRDGHRLVEMMRRLSSYIEIRQPHYDYREYNESFLIADGSGLLHRRVADRYEGTAGFHLPPRARELGNFFDEVWLRSESHSALRRLHL